MVSYKEIMMVAALAGVKAQAGEWNWSDGGPTTNNGGSSTDNGNWVTNA